MHWSLVFMRDLNKEMLKGCDNGNKLENKYF